MSSMIAAFSITPLGTGESVGELVAETVRIVRASGLSNEVRYVRRCATVMPSNGHARIPAGGNRR